MATITSNASGDWGTGATWVGGIAPADGDAVIIAAGHSVKMNVDQSAFTGLLSVTIQGSSGTPGMLYWMDGSNGYLKIRDSGTGILGTSGANKGRLLINSDGVWGNTGALAFATKAILLPRVLDGTNLDINIYCTDPTIKKVRVYGTKTTVTVSGDTFTGATLTNGTYVTFRTTGVLPANLYSKVIYVVISASGNTFKVYPLFGYSSAPITCASAGTGTLEVVTGVTSGSTVLNVFDNDLTTDAQWANTADHNVVCIAPGYYNTLAFQYNTISAKSATTLTLGSATTATIYPEAYVVLVSRNVSIRHTTNASSLLYYIKNAVVKASLLSLTTGGVFQNANNYRGTGIYNLETSTIDSVICGFNIGISLSKASTINGIIVGNNTAISGPLTINNEVHTFSCSILAAANAYRDLYNQSLVIDAYGVGTAFYGCGHCDVSGTAEVFSSIFHGDSKYCRGTGTYINPQYAFTQCYKCGLHDTTIINNPGSVFFNNAFKCFCSATINGCYGIFGGGYDNIFSGTYNDFCGFHLGAMIFGTGVFKNCNLNLPLKSLYGYGPSNQSYTSRLKLSNINSVSSYDGVVELRGSVTRVPQLSASYIPASYDAVSDMLMVHELKNTLSKESPLIIMDDFKVFCLAGSRTISFRIINGFTIPLAAGDLTLAVVYNKSPKLERLVVDSGSIDLSTDWSQTISINFTQSVDGFVDVYLGLNKYEANGRLFIWPWPTVT